MVVQQLAQLGGEALAVEQVADAQAATCHLSSYAGPMPRPVVPILASPRAFSRAWSRAT